METAVDYLIGAQYGSVSDIEIVWTLIAFAGICFSSYNIWDALSNYRALPPQIQNGRRALAKLYVYMEATRITILSIFFTIGVFAFTLKDGVDQTSLPLKIAIFSAILRWGLVISGLLILFQSYANYRVRRELHVDYPIADMPDDN